MSQSAINSRDSQCNSIESRVIQVVRLLRRHGVELWWLGEDAWLELDERDVHALLNHPSMLRQRSPRRKRGGA